MEQWIKLKGIKEKKKKKNKTVKFVFTPLGKKKRDMHLHNMI